MSQSTARAKRNGQPDEPPAIELRSIKPDLTLEEAGFIYQMIQGSTLPYQTVAIAQAICAKLEALAPQE